MFSQVGKLIYQNEAVAQTADFTMGIEIEMDRIDSQGNLSQEPYPSSIGDEKTNPWMTNDFLEVMSETVTPAADYALEAMHYLYALNTTLRNALAPGELLWPLSMPPRLPKDKTKLVLAKMGPKKEAYLKEWAKRHGYAAGTPCGVHINLSIKPHIVKLVQANQPDRFPTERDAKNYLYTVVAQGFVRYRWLLTYLFGASPLAEANYLTPQQHVKHPMRSMRQSSYGFGTKFRGDFTDLDRYVARIEEGVKEGILTSDYEFHGPVRFKGNSELKKLQKEGIQYVELRMLDLDPTTAEGVKTVTLRFIRLLASYFIMHPAMTISEVDEVLKQADECNRVVAEEDPREVTQYQSTALALIKRLSQYANQIQLGPEYTEILDELEDRILNPLLTPSAQLLNYVEDGSLTKYALQRAKRYQEAALESLHPFHGFEGGKIYSTAELKEALTNLK